MPDYTDDEKAVWVIVQQIGVFYGSAVRAGPLELAAEAMSKRGLLERQMKNGGDGPPHYLRSSSPVGDELPPIPLISPTPPDPILRLNRRRLYSRAEHSLLVTGMQLLIDLAPRRCDYATEELYVGALQQHDARVAKIRAVAEELREIYATLEAQP